MFRLKSTSPVIFNSFFYNPWLYFFTFSVANIILSYTESAPKTLLLITSFGLFFSISTALFFLLNNKPTAPPLYLKETIPNFSPLWFFLILFFSLLPRLYILFNSTWPIPDDGLSTFNSIELLRKWVWRFFFTQGQTPPLNFWIQGFYFKLLTPSILSMRFFYFILSIVAVILSFLFSKKHFSRSMTFFILAFSAFSFPSLYTARFSFYAQTLFTFQIIAFGFLLTYLNSASSREYRNKGWTLGLITGVGFWVAIQWPLAACAIAVAVFLTVKTKEIKTTIFKNISFWSPLSLLVIPFLLASFHFKNGDHIRYLLNLPPVEGVNCLNSFFSNWTSLFWGCNTQNSYGPVWGGMLNPVAGSLFFVGFIELIRTRSNGLSRWIFCSFFIFMIPGLITGTFDVFRNSLTFPLLIFVCALGAQSLYQYTSPQWRNTLLVFVLLFSTSLDLIHLWKTYHPIASNSSAIEFSKSFQILKETNNQKGPGEILWGFDTDINDTTLDVATYGFNAAENPRLSPENTQWVAFIANANYKTFLANKFPNAEFYWLGMDSFWNQGGLMLVLVFKDKKNESTLEHWNKVNKEFHNSTDDYFLNPLVGQERSNYQKFLETEPLIKGDRFLESIFYEKLAYFQRTNSDRRLLIALIKNAAQKGYPAAHLLVTEGLLWRAEGNYPEAEKAFKKAMRSQLNLTDAKKNLKILGLLKKAP